jgi:hypothetical protein
MKYLETLPGGLVLIARLAWVALNPEAGRRALALQWAGDWIAVLALLWIAVTLTRENSRLRNVSLGIACVWLAGIYAAHQAVWTFAGWN